LVWTSASLATVTALILIVLHRPLLGLFGADFLRGSTVMIVLVVGRLFNSVTGPSGSLLAMTEHQDVNAIILAVCVFANAAGALVGTAAWGMEGAAFATSLSLTLMTVWTWVEVRRRLHIDSSVLAGFGAGRR
jgi:O-antigen/teichoic acid export membrane protein